MTDHSPDHAERTAIVHALLHSEGEQIVRDMAAHVGDEVHGVLRRHGMMMRTTAGTIAMGILASLQMLAETVEFARKSMDGDASDEEAIVHAALSLFADEAEQSLPALPAALRGRDAVAEGHAVDDAIRIMRCTSAHETQDADEIGQSITATKAAAALDQTWRRLKALWKEMAFPRDPNHLASMDDEMDRLLGARATMGERP